MVPFVLKPISTVHSLGHPVYLDLKPPALPVEVFVHRCSFSPRTFIDCLQDAVAVFLPSTPTPGQGAAS